MTFIQGHRLWGDRTRGVGRELVGEGRASADVLALLMQTTSGEGRQGEKGRVQEGSRGRW